MEPRISIDGSSRGGIAVLVLCFWCTVRVLGLLSVAISLVVRNRHHITSHHLFRSFVLVHVDVLEARSSLGVSQ